jgi:subtilisin-like proprotein convertase family protein
MKRILGVFSAIFIASLLSAQSSEGFWQDIDESAIALSEGAVKEPAPHTYRSLWLDYGAMVSYLRQAPMEFSAVAASGALALALPLPDGGMVEFAVWESPVLEPALSERFPGIRTYAGKATEMPGLTIRLAVTLHGFNAIVQSPEGTWFVSPWASGQQAYYMSYYLKHTRMDLAEDVASFCGLEHPAEGDSADEGILFGGNERGSGNPVSLYTYRLAVATTGEYSLNAGGTAASVLSSVTNVVNQINSVFERDNAIRLVLIDNTSETFFFNPTTDPYLNGNTQNMILENLDVLNSAYTNAGYDIGHVFGTNGGGLASLASVCSGGLDSGHKSRGASCRFGPYSGNLFYLVVGHEVGHQFNATHTFNKCDDENETPATAYEPGSGSSIMCYNGNGVCGNNHLQDVSDSYFHINSLERIRVFSRNGNTGGACAQVVPTGNTSPDVSIPLAGGFNIPISTPFELTGVATDVDADNLTYSWEQYDLGPSTPLGSQSGNAPLFRSFPPAGSPTRVFPKLATIVGNGTDPQELLPNASRPLTFRFTARDNNEEAGGYSFAEIQFNATAQAGPFLVTQPNGSSISWEVGSYVEVTWDVANTNQAPVNCQHVNIRLSKDGGYTYPYTLLAQTPNDGSAYVVVPDELTATARVRVEAADNIFFDISNQNFSIVPPSQPGFSLMASPEYGSVCTPSAFSIQIQTSALLGFAEAVNFTVEGLPAGAVANFAANPVNPGDATTLEINTDDVTAHGEFILTLKAEAGGVPVQSRDIIVFFISSDFSALAVLSPLDGVSGQSGLPTFTWTALPNALSYDFQVADDPAFANIVDQAAGLTGASYTPSLTLSDNKIYYWRLKASNSCGSGQFMDPASFHTIAQVCKTVVRPDTSWQISSAGLPYLQDKITIQESGIISDINVRYVKGNHNAIGDMAFRLKNPAGDSVTLLSTPPCNGTLFNLGFDDQSPFTSIPCPPNTGSLYKPVQALGAFNGENIQGTWTLVVAIVNTLGAGGTYNGWALEYCASLLPKDPFLVINDTLPVPPDGTRLIYQDRLVVDDEDSGDSQLQFTIVTNTQHGTVFLNGQPLGVGDHFTMKDVYSSAVQYTNTNPDAEYDYFTFGVNDGAGGYFGTPRFNIKIDPNAEPSGSGTVVEGSRLGLFPNPAASRVTVELPREVAGSSLLTVSDLQGRSWLRREFSGRLRTAELSISDLPVGMYLVQVRTDSGYFTGKLVVER